MAILLVVTMQPSPRLDAAESNGGVKRGLGRRTPSSLVLSIRVARRRARWLPTANRIPLGAPQRARRPQAQGRGADSCSARRERPLEEVASCHSECAAGKSTLTAACVSRVALWPPTVTRRAVLSVLQPVPDLDVGRASEPVTVSRLTANQAAGRSSRAKPSCVSSHYRASCCWCHRRCRRPNRGETNVALPSDASRPHRPRSVATVAGNRVDNLG